jgi:KDO2-lipid IV(A) lauroyltransferase
MSLLASLPDPITRCGLHAAAHAAGLSSWSRQAHANLELALGEELDAAARRRTARACFHHAARVAADCLRLSRAGRGDRRARRVRRWVEQSVTLDESLALLDTERQAGRGVVLATAHIGNWELLGARLTPHVRSNGVTPVAVGLDRHGWLRRLRGSYGLESLPQNTHPRRLLEFLAEGRPIALLADMEVRRLAGTFLPFFGTEALTMTAPAALARSANCSILPVRCYLPHGENTYRIRFEQPLRIDPSLPRKQATSDLMRRLNSTYESWIRETPEQWAWYQPRWRTRPGTLEAIPLSARAGRPDLPGANDGPD